MSLLEIDSVNFSYGQHQILSNIYLKVKTGEVVGFLGRNGCGKSTLLKIIFGSLKGTGQSVRIDSVYAERMLTTGRVKFLPQECMLPDYMSAKSASDLFSSDIVALTADEEYLKCENMKFGEMSSGIRKYIETLILLYAPSDFILLDEPFSFISPVLVEKLIPTIKQISEHKGVLLTDHQYRSILEVSDRLYLMKDRGICLISGEGELRDFGYIL